MRRFLAAILLSAIPYGALATQQQADDGLTPEILHWRNSDGTPNRATGLLYRPELLAALSAGQPRENISVRILQAVEQQTPIVVMWTIPPGPGELVGPSHMIISDTTSGSNVPPIWEAQDARDLRAVDPRTPFQQVGIVAAFPRSAFQPGRVVIIYAPLPDNPATGGHRRKQVFGEFQETRMRVK
jgi:hypothetical protein